MTYLQKYQDWCNRAQDPTVKQQLADMKDNPSAIENAFYKDLEFGTAGLRGVMGAGSNCLNIYTIIKTTQGISNYLKANGKTSTAVIFDSRLNSQLFAQTVARVFAQNGIKVYLSADCQPAPVLSYIVRTLKTDTGVNITASHNPKQYNGYKVYDPFGCQLQEDMAEKMLAEINKVDPFTVNIQSLDYYLEQGTVCYITQDLIDKYLDAVLQQNLNDASGIRVAYTPLNGAGHILVPRILRSIGVKNIDICAEQAKPDGNFLTCPSPNPEKREALKLVIELAKAKDCDLVLGTDPDCDRLGVAVRDNKGEYVIMSGNEVGVLLTEYILSSLSQNNAIKKNSVVVKSIVTTAMTNKITAQYGVQTVDVLTGFKFIGNQIADLESKGQLDKYLFGFEETCGYLRGSYVRDKDAVVASMLVAEMAATYKKQGKTLVEVMNDLYAKFGKYEHKTKAYQYDGAAGAKTKQRLLDYVRKNPFTHLAGQKVVSTVDYLPQPVGNIPRSDVLKYTTAEDTILIVRPSGTEPLVKGYITVSGTPEQNKITLEKVLKQLDEIFLADASATSLI